MAGVIANMAIELIRLRASDPRIFGFPEYLAALALMILAWTNADVRYRFRVRVAPLNLTFTTFLVIAGLGILTLLTDVWRAAGWRVIKGNIFTPLTWQLFMGGLFLLTFLVWAWFALIWPPAFGRLTASRFARTIARSLLRGAPGEIAVIAEEMAQSAKGLVALAPNLSRFERSKGPSVTVPRHAVIASDIFSMLADRRFCRVIVEQCPGTALAVFSSMKTTRRFDVPVAVFAKNLVTEAIANKNSFLYHEADWYDNGFLGEIRPLSNAMFGDHVMVDSVGTLLAASFPDHTRWKSDEWCVYSRIVSITWNDFAKSYCGNHSSSLYQALQNIADLPSDLYKGVSDDFDDTTQEMFELLGISTSFLTKAVDELEQSTSSWMPELRVRDQQMESFYDYLAAAMALVVYHASKVKGDKWRWDIQHNAAWSSFFTFSSLDSVAGNVVKHKLRRALYNDVAKMTQFPNFKGASILGMCLNVMGLHVRRSDHSKDTFALHKAVISWTTKNFASLYAASDAVVEACLVAGGLSYDPTTRLLSKTTLAPITRTPRTVSIMVSPIPE